MDTCLVGNGGNALSRLDERISGEGGCMLRVTYGDLPPSFGVIGEILLDSLDVLIGVKESFRYG